MRKKSILLKYGKLSYIDFCYVLILLKQEHKNKTQNTTYTMYR